MNRESNGGVTERIAGAVVLAPWRLFRWFIRSKYRLLLLTLLIFGTLVGGGYQAYGYWSSPSFCVSCHLMEPYYASWQHSAHRDVRCVDCHFEPGIGNELRGKWVAIKQLASTLAGSYSSMPYAEVSDASCLRSGCHSQEQLEKPVPFSGRGIKFDHRGHLGEMRRGIKLACTSCHHQRLVTTHMEVDKSTCFLCHFKGAEAEGGHALGSCDTCHGPPSDVRTVASYEIDHREYRERGMSCVQCHVELKSGSGAVGKERCLSCHNRKEQIEKITDPGLLHVEHVTKHKLHCYQCHSMIEHRFSQRSSDAQQQDCAACHQSSHTPQALLYEGTGAKGVADLRDPMHGIGVDCAGCHANASHETATNGSHATTFVAGAASCKSCHADRYDEFVGAMRETFGAMTAHLDQRVAAAQAELDKLSKGGKLLDPAVYRAVKDSAYNVGFVKLSHGIHNPLYAMEILRGSYERLAEAEESLGLEVDEDGMPEAFEREACYVCHDTLKAPGKLQLDKDRVYDHPLHVEKTALDCTDCHQGEAHPPRAPTTESSCKACHKDDKKK